MGISKPKAFASIYTYVDLFFIQPSSVNNALHSLECKSSLQDEYVALVRNNTYTFVPCPKDINIVGSM